MAAAFASGNYSMREIALAFVVHYSTVSRAVKANGREPVGRQVPSKERAGCGMLERKT